MAKKDYKKYKTLVLGVDDRAALTVIRSLGRKGIKVDHGIDVASTIASKSRYVRNVITLPSAANEPEQWVRRLMYHLRQEKYDLVIPTSDAYLVVCVQHRNELEPLAKFAIPDDHGFIYTYRKGKTLELAESLDVPAPLTTRIEKFEDVEAVIEQYEFPIIVKPVSSKVWHHNVRHELDVMLVRDRRHLDFVLAKILPLSPVLLQSFHSGVGVGQEFLMHEGELVAAFQHERVHEPLGGGGSTYRKSVPLDQKLLEHSLDMLKELGWTGVAMVEYKQNKSTGHAVLMEINGRFWGSLPLAVASGVDFPGLLFDSLVLNKRTPSMKYRKNIHSRNLVNDFEWLKENIRADRSDPFKMTVPLPKLFGEILNFLLLRERWDTIAPDDPRPGLKHVGGYFWSQIEGGLEKVRTLAIRANHQMNPLRLWRRKRALVRSLAQHRSVNFVCKGNICRSPFAEFYFRDLMNKNNVNHFHIDSVGLIERINRESPPNAIEAASNFGIDMTSHRSRLLTNEVVDESGILFVMDLELYQRVRLMFPHARHKLFFLGEVAQGYPRQLEISDPYGGGLDYFKKIYSQIIYTVDGLFDLVKDQKTS